MSRGKGDIGGESIESSELLYEGLDDVCFRRLEAAGLGLDDFFDGRFDRAEVFCFDLAASESLGAAATRFPVLFLLEAREGPLLVFFEAGLADTCDRRVFSSDCKARVAVLTCSWMNSLMS